MSLFGAPSSAGTSLFSKPANTAAPQLNLGASATASSSLAPSGFPAAFASTAPTSALPSTTNGVSSSVSNTVTNSEPASAPISSSGIDVNQPATALLNELLESSRNLPTVDSNYGSVLLDLSEISDRARSLRKDGKNDENDTKAHYLLAGSGVNAANIATDIQQLLVHQNIEQSTFSTDKIDLDNFLRHKKEENILAAIDESVKFAAKEYDLFLSQNLSIDWRVRKREIFQHFGLIKPGDHAKETENESFSAADKSGSPDLIWGKITLGRRILGTAADDSDFTDVAFFRPNAGFDYSRNNSGNQDQSELNGDSTVGLGSVPSAAILTSGPQYQMAVSSAETRSRKQALLVQKLNDYRQADRLIPLSIDFGAIAKEHASDIQSQHISDAWKILTEIIGETTESIVPPRFFLQYYSQKNPHHADAINLRKRIVSGAKRYLNNLFFQYIDDAIAAAPQDARLGGVPSVLNKIRAYVNLKFYRAGAWQPNLQLVNGVPFWPVIFYLIRSGAYQDAVKFSMENESGLDQVEKAFVSYMISFAESEDNELSPELLVRLHTEFNQRIANFNEGGDDPYKYAIYKLFGRCGLSRKAFPGNVISTAEDWIWAQFMLAKEGEWDSIPTNEKYGLLDIQKIVVQFGDSHFNPQKSNPGLYFKLLLMCGLFEWAVHYCYSFSKSDAVHFAAVLNYYGLLKIVTDTSKIGSELAIGDNEYEYESNGDGSLDSHNHPSINLPRLIGYYTKSFRRFDPRVAVEYLVLLSINRDLPGKGGEAYGKITHEALRELVLETREFAILLGDILADGSRVPGAIEERMSLISLAHADDYLHTIAEQAAVKADEDGRTADAVLLYQLAEEYDTVMTIINKAVGEALLLSELGKPVSEIPEGASMVIAVTDNPAQVARSILSTYQSNPIIISNVSPRNQETCEALLHIVDARECFANYQWEECLKCIEKTQVVTVGADSNMSVIREKAQQFLSLDDSIARNVPVVLVMAMKCCVNLSRALSQAEYPTGTIATVTNGLRDIAKNIMVYAGMIHYRMSGEIYTELTNLELMI